MKAVRIDCMKIDLEFKNAKEPWKVENDKVSIVDSPLKFREFVKNKCGELRFKKKKRKKKEKRKKESQKEWKEI